jgi:hypothetical protein
VCVCVCVCVCMIMHSLYIAPQVISRRRRTTKPAAAADAPFAAPSKMEGIDPDPPAVATISDATSVLTPPPPLTLLLQAPTCLPTWLHSFRTTEPAAPGASFPAGGPTSFTIPQRLMGCTVLVPPGDGAAPPPRKASIDSDGVVNMSFSRLSDYTACPLRYHYNYNLRVKVPPNRHLILGQAMHSAIEAHARRVMQGKPADIDVLHAAFMATWTPDGCDGPTEAQAIQSQALAALRSYHELESSSRMGPPGLVEQVFQIAVRGEVRVTGVWDRVDFHPETSGKAIVKEYKKALSDYQIKHTGANLQLHVYAWAFEAVFGFLPTQVLLQEIGSATKMGTTFIICQTVLNICLICSEYITSCY